MPSIGLPATRTLFLILSSTTSLGGRFAVLDITSTPYYGKRPPRRTRVAIMRVSWAVLLACPVSALHSSSSGNDDGQARTSPQQQQSVARREQASNPGADIFIRRWHPATVKLGNQLIVDGGSVSRRFNGSHSANGVNVTLSIPLDSSWTNSSLVMTEISRTLLPSNNAPVLWSDEENKAVYFYGGDSIGRNASYTGSKQLFKLRGETAGGATQAAWSTSEPANAANFSELYNPARSSYATCNGMGFSLGGYVNGGTDDRFSGSQGFPLPGLVTYEFATRTWANQSLVEAFDAHLHGYYPAGGSAVCLPTLGKRGMVMFLGGRAIARSGKAEIPVQFDKMTFYDIASGTWRTQSTTTGDGLPDHRRDACAAATRGRNGSYEVFLFGGRPATGESNQAHADMWVLTIPGFRWFKATGPAAQLGEGRAFTSCAAVGRQLVVVGGVKEQSNKQWTEAQVDPWTQGVGVFDMQELGWRDGYKHDLEAYDSPQVVKEWYSGGGVANWDDGGMQEFFAEAAASPAPAPAPGSGTTSPAGGSSSGGLSKGATIGVAVGVSILGLIVIAVLAWCCIRRRRRNASQRPSELAGDSGHGAMTNSHYTLAPSSTYVGSSSPSPGLAGRTTSPLSKSELAANDQNGLPQDQHHQNHGQYFQQGAGQASPQMQEYYGGQNQVGGGVQYPQPQQGPAELPGQEPPMQPYEVSAHPSSAPGGAYPVHELRS
ncbi:hypothetical protein Micbo1qcDRAFT_236385 [Microdochium bolleyi]|uniref:Kelch repeat protein n=1 Tax=Microdochium bolleyi TaxID=196109 RepID=A0A136IRZ0_9PEZI|nr:hypothetical protein Micbo1qcDRAFT_236385 [Microdochium bolleyi]